MVTYEFRCPKCQKVFTVAQGMLEDHLADCPLCSSKAQRVWSLGAFQIDWVNGGFHGDEKNMGTGNHHKSTKEREYWASSHGLRKAKDG